MFSDLQVLADGNNFARLLQGLGVSIQIALLSMALSIVLGTLMGVAMTSKNRIVHVVTQAYLQFVRIMPQLVLLFLVYFDATRAWGLNLDARVAALEANSKARAIKSLA